MNIKLWCALCIFFIVTVGVNSQDDKFDFYVSIAPKGAFVKIDGKEYELIDNGNFGDATIRLSKGEYLLEVWHPMFTTISENITISPQGKNRYSKGLKTFSSKFIDYNNSYLPRKKKRTNQFAGIAIANIGGLFATFFYNKNKEKNLLDEIENSRFEYESNFDPNLLVQLRGDFEKKKSDYISMQENRNLRRTIGIPIMIGVAYLSYKFIKKKNKEFKRLNSEFDPGSPFSLIVNDSDKSLSLIYKF